MNNVTIKLVKDNLSPILDEIKSKSEVNKSLKQIFQSLFNLSDFLMKITTINIDNSSTSTSELFITLEPTDSFRSFCTAILAGDFDSFFLEHNKFLSEVEKI